MSTVKDSIIPATRAEFDALGWDQADIIIVSGDAYVDHPAFGTAVIARVLQSEGYKVAVIDQPDTTDPQSVAVFGAPRLFFGVTAGNVDSLLSRYTAFHKVRNDDPFSPQGVECPRPERASIFYTNMLNRAFKGVPVVLGGVEASMRRFLHFDFKTEKLRRSILEDSRADILVYGMGESAIVDIARRMEYNEPLEGIAGTVIFQASPPPKAIMLPSEEDGMKDKDIFTKTFKLQYTRHEQILAQPVAQRYLVQYPSRLLPVEEIDAIYELPYTRQPHPKYQGRKIPAWEMIKDSVTSHRGCASGCAFCSLSLHQGRKIQSRSKESVLREIKKLSTMKSFHGHVTDIGGPSANMYHTVCTTKDECVRQSCLYPAQCKYLEVHTSDWIDLLDEAQQLAGVKHVTVGSGVRYDLLMHDDPRLLDRLVPHISGNIKVAPESTDEKVLKAMRKTPLFSFEEFVEAFDSSSTRAGKKYSVIPYLMSNHPGGTRGSMVEMKNRITKAVGYAPRQVQSFIPLPMTLSSVQYYTGKDPFTGEALYAEHDMGQKRKQHEVFFEEGGRPLAKTGKHAKQDKGGRKSQFRKKR